MKILVTGGAGFIGSHFSARLLDLGHTVTALDNFNDYYNPALKRDNLAVLVDRPRYTMQEGDILDQALLQRLFAENDFAAVVHLAARAGVRPSLQEPQLYSQVNVTGTINLLESCRQFGVRRFLFASSSSVYGANQKIPFSETDRTDASVSPYAATKKAGEVLCHAYHHLYGLSITCLRFFTVYGPRQRPDMAIHKFARLIAGEKPIPVFGDGRSRRDYTYIDDILQGLTAALDHCNGFNIYNLGESRTTELLHLIELLEASLQQKAKVQFFPEQAGDVPLTYADISRAAEDLNYHPHTSVEQGIPRFVAWFREKQNYLTSSD
jgi:UDP-glucuronate 4-epimerase